MFLGTRTGRRVAAGLVRADHGRMSNPVLPFRIDPEEPA
jgi:hypothetical protein